MSEPKRRHSRLKTGLILTALFPFFTMLALAFLLSRQIYRQIQTADWVEHTELVISKTEKTGKLLLDLETGERGFLLTGNDDFLAPYDQALSHLPEHFANLQNLLNDNPRQVERVRELKDLVDDWVRYAQLMIQKKRKGDNYLRHVIAGEGKRRMDNIRAHLDLIVATEETLRNERSQRNEDESRQTLFFGLVATLGSGTLFGFFFWRRTQTVSKVYEEALNESRLGHARLRSVIDGASAYGIVLLDSQGKIIEWSQGAEKVTGYRSSDIVHRSFCFLMRKEESAASETYCNNLLQQASALGRVNTSGTWVKQDGVEFWAESSLSSFRGREKGDRLYSLVFSDATFRREAETERAFLLSKLREALRSRDDFLGQAAHELRTPLTTLAIHIGGASRIFKRTGELPSKDHYDRLLRDLQESADRLSMRTEQMMDFARIHSGRLAFDFERVNLSELAKQMTERVSVITTLTGTKINFQIQDGVYGWCDRQRVEQILWTLIQNGATFGSGGEVRIQVGWEGKRARIAVRNFGPPIPPVERERIFQPFFQARSPDHQTGLGIGLFIAREVAQGLGGTLELVTPEDGGSEFVLELPPAPVEKRPEAA